MMKKGNGMGGYLAFGQYHVEAADFSAPISRIRAIDTPTQWSSGKTHLQLVKYEISWV
jgi:hypothetical protein